MLRVREHRTIAQVPRGYIICEKYAIVKSAQTINFKNNYRICIQCSPLIVTALGTAKTITVSGVRVNRSKLKKKIIKRFLV